MHGFVTAPPSANMRINALYIENAASAYPLTAQIQGRLEAERTERIEDHQDFFSRKKTPYLDKRIERNIFLAVKKGALVRAAPAAYGYNTGDPHYYHIHAYNCIYECEYCYLQGYFSSPDLVFFVNHDEIIQDMARVLSEHPGRKAWFHAGEFSDSLALSHITGELPLYWEFFRSNADAFLELRTKSINITELRRLEPLPNVIVSFSLSGEKQAAELDREAPGISQRLNAMRRLKDLGFKLAVHFDPIVYSDSFEEQFAAVTESLNTHIPLNYFEYFSLGVVRFAKDAFKEAKKNYPESGIFARRFIQGEDQKMRYVRPFRLGLLETAQGILKKHGCPEEKIYFCME